MDKFIESLRTITDSHHVALEKLRFAQEELQSVEEPLNALREEIHQLTLELKREQMHEAEAFLQKDSLVSHIHKLRSGIQELEIETKDLDEHCSRWQCRSMDIESKYGLKLEQFREDLSSLKQSMQANSAAFLELQRIEGANKLLSFELQDIMQQLHTFQSGSTAHLLDKEREEVSASLAFAQSEYKFIHGKLMECQVNVGSLRNQCEELRLTSITKDAELKEVANRRANATIRTAQLEERIVKMRSGNNIRNQ